MLSRRILELCLHYLPGAGYGSRQVDNLRREIGRELERVSRKPMRRKAKTKAKRDETAAIRAVVMARANDACERCGVSGRLEWHHVFSKGKGRPDATERNTLGLCWRCHHVEAHGNPHGFLRWFAAWAGAHGFESEAAAALSRIEGIVSVREREAERSRP